MRRLLLLLITMVVVSANVYSQAFAYKGGSREGLYKLFSNPANIATNKHKVDINLLSIGVLAANDDVKLGLKDVDDLKDKFLNGEEREISGLFNIDVIGPSLALQIAPKHAIAFSTRARVFGNVGTLNSKLAEGITQEDYEEYYDDDAINISTGDQRVTINAWSEFAASWGGVLFDNEEHRLQGGVSVKFLRGTGNSFVDIQDLKGTITSDEGSNKNYLTDASGSIYLVSSGVDMFGDNVKASDLTKSNGNGIGFDIGFTYEYKGEYVEEDNNVDIDENNIDEEKEKTYNKDYQYKFKVGVALLDVGSLSYKSERSSAYHYRLNIPAGERLYLKDLNTSIEGMQDYLDESPYATKEDVNETYEPSLPTTLNVMLDYRWGGNFYTELSGQFSLIDEDKKIENTYYYNGITFTPRIEGGFIGLALPLNYNSISDFNAGVTLRMGPIMVGSGSALTALFSDTKQADVFVGFKFGF